MRYLFILIAFISLFATSCTKECERTITGTVVDHITQESIPNVPIELTGRKTSRSGIGATFWDYEAVTDNMGNFEISTDRSLDRWDRIQIELDDYMITSSESSVSDFEVCGENHVHIELHRFADLHLKFIDENRFDATGVTIRTSVDWYSFQFDDLSTNLETIKVLEEEDEISLRYVNKYTSERIFEEEIKISVARGEHEELEIRY